MVLGDSVCLIFEQPCGNRLTTTWRRHILCQNGGRDYANLFDTLFPCLHACSNWLGLPELMGTTNETTTNKQAQLEQSETKSAAHPQYPPFESAWMPPNSMAGGPWDNPLFVLSATIEGRTRLLHARALLPGGVETSPMGGLRVADMSAICHLGS